MLTVTVNSARNKQGMGINGKTHSPLGPQQTREWKNKRSTAWKRQDVRLGGEDRPPGNQLKPNQLAKTQQERDIQHWTVILYQQNRTNENVICY